MNQRDLFSSPSPPDARALAHGLIDAGHRALGEGDRATRVHAGIVARWLHAITRAAWKPPTLPDVEPDPPEDLDRRAAGAAEVLTKDTAAFQRRYWKHRRAGLSSRAAADEARDG